MSTAKLIAILVIFLATSVGWFILGASVVSRTRSSDEQLAAEVRALWGGPHVQLAPRVWMEEAVRSTETVEQEDEAGNPVVRRVTRSALERHALPLESSRVRVDLELEHRRKGLLWYDLFGVDFTGRYEVRTPAEVTGPLRVSFRFPAAETIYDSFEFKADGVEGTTHALEEGVEIVLEEVEPNREIPISIGYRSRGLDTWLYAFQEAGIAQLRNLDLVVTTDFADFDVPAGTLSPTSVLEVDGGWKLSWQFSDLVTGKTVGIDLPNRLNPGPLTARVTFFAPVSLLFFITVMTILGMVKNRNLHPMHYFFLSAAFFAFHLLLAYLVDHVDVHLAFLLAAAASVFLVVSYLRVVGGNYFALVQAWGAQFAFLVLFNYAFFFEGFTGLAITLGAIVTLFVLMQLTASTDWDRAFAARGTLSPLRESQAR